MRIRAREERRSSCGCVGVRALILMRMGGAREGEGGGTRFSLFPLPHYSALPLPCSLYDSHERGYADVSGASLAIG